MFLFLLNFTQYLVNDEDYATIDIIDKYYTLDKSVVLKVFYFEYVLCLYSITQLLHSTKRYLEKISMKLLVHTRNLDEKLQAFIK